ncbi:hypothetical protein H4R35_005244 [Dimargaris xerosporica]|nr:hypothetical protein H4R35_005244 [Dimargaris xerosporica]
MRFSTTFIAIGLLALMATAYARPAEVDNEDAASVDALQEDSFADADSSLLERRADAAPVEAASHKSHHHHHKGHHHHKSHHHHKGHRHHHNGYGRHSVGYGRHYGHGHHGQYGGYRPINFGGSIPALGESNLGGLPLQGGLLGGLLR